MADLSIRSATRDDVPGIQRVGERAWSAVYDDVLDQATIDAALEEWYSLDTLHDYIQHSDVAYFVGEHDDCIVGADDPIIGFVAVGRNELDTGEIGAIYVDPDHWRQGHGTALLQHAEAYGRERDWDTIQIRVVGGNDVARTFYEQHGYQETLTVTVDLFDEPIKEVCYEKSLD